MAADRFVRLTLWLGFGVSAVVSLTEWALASTFHTALGASFGRASPLIVSPGWLLVSPVLLFLVAVALNRRPELSLEHVIAYQAVVIVALFGATMILAFGTVLLWAQPGHGFRW
jgi:hypothetical protein